MLCNITLLIIMSTNTLLCYHSKLLKYMLTDNVITMNTNI